MRLHSVTITLLLLLLLLQAGEEELRRELGLYGTTGKDRKELPEGERPLELFMCSIKRTTGYADGASHAAVARCSLGLLIFRRVHQGSSGLRSTSERQRQGGAAAAAATAAAAAAAAQLNSVAQERNHH